ncbi:MAG: RNA-binding S4 domain-containing protein [Bacilli bacterium]|jgi:ribosomal 50S subunit-recycling heat shock protein
MRLDKYLKISRIIKRRSIAKELAISSYILVNGKTAKPSTDVVIGDKIELFFDDRHILCEVLLIRESASIYECNSMYSIIIDEKMNRNI